MRRSSSTCCEIEIKVVQRDRIEFRQATKKMSWADQAQPQQLSRHFLEVALLQSGAEPRRVNAPMKPNSVRSPRISTLNLTLDQGLELLVAEALKRPSIDEEAWRARNVERLGVGHVLRKDCLNFVSLHSGPGC